MAFSLSSLQAALSPTRRQSRWQRSSLRPARPAAVAQEVHDSHGVSPTKHVARIWSASPSMLQGLTSATDKPRLLSSSLGYGNDDTRATADASLRGLVCQFAGTGEYARHAAAQRVTHLECGPASSTTTNHPTRFYFLASRGSAGRPWLVMNFATSQASCRFNDPPWPRGMFAWMNPAALLILLMPAPALND